MTWVVRPASSLDVDRLALIGSASFLETFAGVLDGDAIVLHCEREHSRTAYERCLDAGNVAWLGETGHGRAPIGFALLGPSHLPGSAADGSDIELKRIYTLSRFHGTGLGAALLQQAVAHAGANGFRRLLLGVYAGNDRARAFYARSGFVQIGERRFRVGNREYDDVVLARQVAPAPAGTGAQ